MSHLKLSRRRFLQLITLTPLAGSLVRGRLSYAQSRSWFTTGQTIPALASFDTTLQNYMQARNIPGGALAVTRFGKLVLARGYNWQTNSAETVQPNSLFRIASISKTLTGTAVIRLAQDGKLRLV
jgi:CubicO group peptidase (beta-lactamase class C family)